MESRICSKEIDGVPIFLIDHSHLKKDVILKQVFYSFEKINELQNKVNFLIDISGAEMTPEIVGNLIAFGKIYQKLVIKSAIVGVNRTTLPFFKMYVKMTGSKLKPFDSIEKALEHLTS